jgi:hypothetical protein
MRESILNDPLAAEEIKAITIAKIEDALSRNQALIDDVTYAGFRVQFEIKFEFINSATPGTLVWGVEHKGEQTGQVLTVVEADKYQSDPSPNKTREENDLPLPVMVNTPSGPQKRRVRIKDAKARKK